MISLVALCVYAAASLLAAFVPRLPIGRKGDNPVPRKEYIVRFIVGFTTSNLSILLSYVNIYASGVALAFPSVALTALISLW